MSEITTAICKGFLAFVATNIDDILILAVLFSQINNLFRRHHIVLGQYLGFGLLVFASLSGFFMGSFLIPPSLIKWLGLVPILMGITVLLREQEEPEEEEGDSEIYAQVTKSSFPRFSNFLAPQTYGVAALTVANGSDNIGVYVPLFASSSSSSLVLIITTFLALVGVWCYLAYKIISLPFLSQIVTGYTPSFMPCILIGLGVFIVKESILLSLIALVASCLCLFLFSKNRVLSSN